jgi:hypothetical protein
LRKLVLLDRGQQYDPIAKRIDWKGFIEFKLYKKYSNSHIWIWMFWNSWKVRFYFRNVFYTILGVQGYIICYFWICTTYVMNFTSLNNVLFILFEIQTNFQQDRWRGVFWLAHTDLGLEQNVAAQFKDGRTAQI